MDETISFKVNEKSVRMNEDTLQVAELGCDERLYPLNRREFLLGVGSGIIFFFMVGKRTIAACRTSAS